MIIGATHLFIKNLNQKDQFIQCILQFPVSASVLFSLFCFSHFLAAGSVDTITAKKARFETNSGLVRCVGILLATLCSCMQLTCSVQTRWAVLSGGLGRYPVSKSLFPWTDA